MRLPHLSAQEFHDLYAGWSEHYTARDAAKTAEVPARLARLWAERDALFDKRASAPQSEHAAITARIAAIGRELAELVAPVEMLSLISVRTE